jgi:ferredoxin
MRVIVDFDLCEGNARCVTSAPEVFELDEHEDVVHLLSERPPEELRLQVAEAVRRCPRQALRVEG